MEWFAQVVRRERAACFDGLAAATRRVYVLAPSIDEAREIFTHLAIAYGVSNVGEVERRDPKLPAVCIDGAECEGRPITMVQEEVDA